MIEDILKETKESVERSNKMLDEIEIILNDIVKLEKEREPVKQA